MGGNVEKREKEDVGALARQTAGIVSGYLAKNRAVIIKTLPRGFNYDRMCRTVINAISTTPTLAKCDAASIFLSCVRGFSLGLEPNGALAEGYLVPYWNSCKQVNEAQFMPSYRGLINLARRSGEIAEIYAKAVYPADRFEAEEGTDRRIVHKPDYTRPRGEAAVCYYAIYKTRDGGTDFEVMSKHEIDAIRARSKAANSGPWVTDYDQMALKTVLKRLLKRAPMSVELAAAVELENAAAMGDGAGAVLDVAGLELPDGNDTPAEVRKAVNAERAETLREKIAAKKASTPDAPAPLRSEQIAGLLRKSNAPVTLEQFIAYCRDNLRIADIDDVPAWGATENRKFMESPEAYVSEVANKIADSLI